MCKFGRFSFKYLTVCLIFKTIFNFSVILLIVDRISDKENAEQFLKNFVYLNFNFVVSSDNEEITHSVLCKYIPILVIFQHTNKKLFFRFAI